LIRRLVFVPSNRVFALRWSQIDCENRGLG